MPANILQRFAAVAVCLAASGVAMAQIQRGAPAQAELRSPAADIERGSVPFVGDDWSFPDLVERLPFGSSYDSASKSDGDVTSSCAIDPVTYNDTWYRWVAPSDGEATLGAFSGTVGPGLIVAVYRSSCQFEPLPEFDEVACDALIPVAGELGLAEVSATWSARRGTTYLLQVGFPTDPPPAPTTGTNDVNTWLTFQGVAGGEDCDTASDVGATPFTVRSNTFDFAADGPPGSCNDPGATVMQADAWWSWTAPADGAASLRVVSDGNEAIAAVYDGTCDALNEIDCASQVFLPTRGGATATINFAAAAGTTYYLQVGLPDITTPSTQRGGATIDVWLTAELAPGDDCATAVVIPDAPFLTQYDPDPLPDGTSDSACFGGTLLNDGWYQWTAPADGDLSLATEIVGPSFGSILLNVFSGACESLELEGCSFTNFEVRDIPVIPINVPVLAGTTYYIQIGVPQTEVMPRGGPPPIYFDLTFDIPCPEGTFQKLMSDDARSVDLFGNAVDVQGDLAVVVAPAEDENGASAGSAYVFEFDLITEQWIQIAKLLASDGITQDHFGTAVSLNGPYIAVGAATKFGSTTGEGAVYIFERDAGDPTLFNEIKKIISPAPQQVEKFGSALDFLGTTLVVGNRIGPGTVYVFDQDLGGANMFGLAQTITADATGRFGWDLWLSGDLLIAGAPGDNGTDPGEGSAYVYRFEEVVPRGPVIEEYVLVRKIVNPDPEPFARFGGAVAIDATSGYAVVGADEDRRIANLAGRAFTFEQNLGGPDNFGFAATLAPSDLMSADNFGFDVAMLGDVAFVGCPLADLVPPMPPMPRGEAPTTIENVGAVYVFTRDTDGPGAWGQVAKIHALDADPGDLFGNAVNIDLTGQLIVGAEGDDEAIGNAGAAYVGPGGYADCNLNGILDICDILDGTSEDADGDLVPDECIADLCRGFNIFLLDQRYPMEDALYGFSAALDNFRAIIGAPFASDPDFRSGSREYLDYIGSATIFSFSLYDRGFFFEWIDVAELFSPDPQEDEGFGWDVDLSEDSAIVGAPFRYINEPRGLFGSGAAYAYERFTILPLESGFEDWESVQPLLAQDTVDGDLFGYAVDVEQDFALVGAPGVDIGVPETGEPMPAPDTGAVYAFDRYQVLNVPIRGILPYTFYTEVQKITLDTPSEGQAFGAAIDVDASTAAIGAPGSGIIFPLYLVLNPALGTDPPPIEEPIPGAAYVFERQLVEDRGMPPLPSAFDWTQIAELIPSESTEFDGYGLSVAVEGDFAVVGAPLFGEDLMLPSPQTGASSIGGAVFVFHRNAGGDDNWGQVAKLTAFDAEPEDLFGWSVSLSGDFLIVGAPGDDLTNDDFPFAAQRGMTDVVPEAGSIYVFQHAGSDPADWASKGKFIGFNESFAEQGPPDGFFSQALGISADLDGSFAVAGGPTTPVYDEFVTGTLLPNAGQAYGFAGIADCQPNDMLDFCDMFYGESEDIAPENLVPDECDAVGACCLDFFFFFPTQERTSSGCIDTISEAECGYLRGTFLGEESVCSETSCYGACCVAGALPNAVEDPSCVQNDALDCLALGGVFLGVGSLCEEVSCDGACCFSNINAGFGDTCFEIDLALCVSEGGSFFGVGTTCALVPCEGEEFGACCPSLGGIDRAPSCIETTRVECEETLMGIFVRNGTTCATTDCFSIGACCWSCPAPNGGPTTEATQCVDALTLDQCCLIDGLWAGPQTACFSMPCTALPICEADLDGDNATNVFDFGIFALNFGCGTGLRERMTCIGDLDCDNDVDVFDFGILALNFGCIGPELPFTQCGSPNKPLTGACCLTNGGRGVNPVDGCVIRTESDCITEGGTYLGDGTDCTGDPCGPPGGLIGACCVTGLRGNEVCIETTELDCNAQGGFYLGDSTDCALNPCILAE